MLWWFFQNALIAAAIAAIVWPLCRIRRLGPAMRHALWLVVLLKLVTPPFVTWPWSAPSILEWLQIEDCGQDTSSVSVGESGGGILPSETILDASPRNEILAGLIDVSSSLSEPTQLVDSGLTGFPAGSIDGSEPNTFEDPAATGSVLPDLFRGSGVSGIQAVWDVRAFAADRIIPLLGASWLLGTAVSILIHVIQVVRFCRLVARSEHPSPSLLRRVTKVAANLRVRPPQVLVVQGIRSPVIWGGVRAQLVWPASLTTQARRASEGPPAGSPRARAGLLWDFESGRWDGVIAHELAHLRRRDHWIGWLELLAGCVWWWNPLFWYVRHQLRENAELACDALVVWALPDGRRTYAESLIEVVSHFSPVATPVPVLGVNSVARQAFERRLTMILCERVPWKLSARGLLAIGVLALVALPGWSLGQVAATPMSEEPTAKEEPKAPAGVYVETPVRVATPPGLPTLAPATAAGQVVNFPERQRANDSRRHVGPDQVVARVNGQEITYKTLIDELLAGKEVSTVLETMVARLIIEQACKERGIEVSPQEVQTQIKQSAERVNLTPEQFLKMLESQRGISTEHYERDIAWPSLALKKLAMQSANVTDENLKKGDYVARVYQSLKDRATIEQQLPKSASNLTDRYPGPSEVQMLSRATYPLPKVKAEALAAFLREHMKNVESGMNDDGKTSLVVTASPEAQAIIGQFIALSEGKQPAPGGAMQLLQPSPNINSYRAIPAQRAFPTTEPAPAKPAVPSEPAAPGPTPPAKQ